MQRFGFTATRTFRPSHHRTVATVLVRELPAPPARQAVFNTGGSWGGDHWIAEWLMDRYPRSRHVLHRPTEQPYDETVLALPFNEIVDYATYRARNGGIVMSSERLFAFPLYDEFRQPRSGTWMTVRIARRQHRGAFVWILEDELSMLEAT